jgi:CxxC-x17-CxxC domain-containing protein
MKNFNDRGGDRGGFKPRGGGFGRPSFRGGDSRDRGPVTMHQAICAECGQSCQVPFRPTGDKPVYCSNCFGKHGGDDRAPRRDFSRPSFERSRENNSNNNNDGLKRQLDSISIKLDQLTRSIDRLVESKIAPVTKTLIVQEPEAPKAKKKVVVKKTKKS